MEPLENRVARYGKSLVTNLSILVKMAGMYDAANETVANAAGRVLSDIEMLTGKTGDISLKIIEGTFYIEGIRIRGAVSDVEGFTYLSSELGRRSVGMIEFRDGLALDDVIHLAYAVKAGRESSDIQSVIEKNVPRAISVGGPVALIQEEEIDLKDSASVARRAYLKAVSVMREVDRSLRTGKRFQLRRVKRALQLVVDCITADETPLLGFASVRTYENYHYYHPVNVAILSAIMGRLLGLDRVQLRSLATAAFFHDIGKSEIPASILDKEGEFTSKEGELIMRHPGDGVRLLLYSLGVSKTSILSMLVSYEHHMKQDDSGYPERQAGTKTVLFSRIVDVADDYDSLVSGRVYSRERTAPEDALRKIASESGRRYDPVMVKALVEVFHR